MRAPRGCGQGQELPGESQAPSADAPAGKLRDSANRCQPSWPALFPVSLRPCPTPGKIGDFFPVPATARLSAQQQWKPPTRGGTRQLSTAWEWEGRVERGGLEQGWGPESSGDVGPPQEVYTTQDPVQGKAEVQSRGALPTGGPRVSLSWHPVPGTADAPPREGLLRQECGASSPGRLGPHPHQGPCPP